MIAIIDYQMGNLRSVQKGFEKVGHQAVISSDPEVLRKADKVVLPGVGAFGDAMQELQSRSLVEPIREIVKAGKPFLGVCLGMQLLFEIGHEGGRHEGLGIFAGEVKRFDLSSDYKVPHMGWNSVTICSKSPMLAGIANGTHFYFVHSYVVAPEDSSIVALESEYGSPFPAMVWHDNVYATQFHPEKSQTDGLQLLKNFAKLP